MTTKATHTTRSWLWPNRTISKTESGLLREEHNALVNVNADLVAALREALAVSESMPLDLSTARGAEWVDRAQRSDETARALLAKVDGGAS